MSFKKKTEYENLYDWAKSGEGTCFYCKEDKSINHLFNVMGIGDDKGICDDCAKDFTIGQMGADRHAVHALSPEFKTHGEARDWLKSKGAVLMETGYEDGTYFYKAINNMEAFKKELGLRKKGIYEIDDEILYATNSVEISEDGRIHIIY